MKHFVHTVVATAVALSILAATTLPAAAFTFKANGTYARFGPSMATDVRGLVVGDRLGGNKPRLTVSLSGLLASDAFFVYGRSIGCNGTPSAGNRIFRIRGTSDEDGSASFVRALSASNTYGGLTSIWINQGELAPVCAFSLNFSEIEFASQTNADGALGLTKVGTGTLVLLLEQMPNGSERLSVSGVGVFGNGALRVRGVNAPCGVDPTATALSVKLQDVMVSSFKTRMIDITEGQLDSMRSVRVRNLSTNETSCGPLSLIIVVV